MLMLFPVSLGATETGVIYDTGEDEKQLKESCSLGSAYGYSSWSKPIQKNIGYHPETKNWAHVSGYFYKEGKGPKISVDIGYGPFTYVSGDVGTSGKFVEANPKKATRLYMRTLFQTRTYKRKSSYPCNTTHTYRQYKVYEERYYAKQR